MKSTSLYGTVTCNILHIVNLRQPNFNLITKKLYTQNHQIHAISIDVKVTDNIHHDYMSNNKPFVRAFGAFRKYPPGVFNPAFTGMFLLDYSNYEDLSDYKICKFNSIKSGIILYGNEASVFTPFSNNDIHSYLKILLHNKTFHHTMTKSKATKLIVDYIRCNCRKPIIPCLHVIKFF